MNFVIQAIVGLVSAILTKLWEKHRARRDAEHKIKTQVEMDAIHDRGLDDDDLDDRLRNGKF